MYVWVRPVNQDEQWPVEVKEQIGAPGGDWHRMTPAEYAAYCAVHGMVPVRKQPVPLLPASSVTLPPEAKKPLNIPQIALSAGLVLNILLSLYLLFKK